MASSSSSPSLSVLSSQSWKYDVFLSFRGEDTRKTFVDHLYSALHHSGIHTYKDDVTLPRGESISPTLYKAIEESQIAVIVFSKNYANSKWCLDELTYIMKRREEGKQTVFPIFFDVEPWEVGSQEGEYKEAFDVHELENKGKVESWRKALKEASKISGWEPKQTAGGHEAQGIKVYVDEISKRLVPSRANADLIGMKTRVEGLKSELKIEAGGVRMIGIWGVGGGGKTTLASSIYDEISSMYGGRCFLKHIREKSSNIGLEKLQKKMLSNIFKQDHMEMARLRHKNVLIVLDDVDHGDQLRALAGSHDWFGQGSRIIITTRDEHLLIAHGVDVIQPISLFNNDEAVELFCKYARRDLKPTEDFEKLSEEVVSYAGGLPLALRVLGSFLCGRTSMQWKSALNTLKNIPHEDIIGILRISFDGLKQYEKDMFLDIACFFRRWGKDDPMKLFDSCGLHPGIGLEVLREKALIVTKHIYFDMHDLVQEMGQYIVREQHPENPEKHSRVWKGEDVERILDMAATTELDNIEAIDHRDLIYDDKLRFLHVAGNMTKLRWIDLHFDSWGDDTKRDENIVPLPSNFPPPQLCYLRVDACRPLKQLWEGSKVLPYLVHMELINLPNLIKIPDFSRIPKLETFKLDDCPCLEVIHPGFGSLESLVLISIIDCPLLTMFKFTPRFKKLKTLVLSEICLEDEERYEFWELPKLEKLKLNLTCNNSSITQLDFRILRLPRLKWLDVSLCDRLVGLSELPRLKWLDVSLCERLVELSELPSSIAVVHVNDCDSFESFGDISNCKWLWNVSLDGWSQLDQCGVDTLINSMLQGNALEDHYISVALFEHRPPNGLIDRYFRGDTFCVHLEDDWYNDYCGFLICIVTKECNPVIKINIKQEGTPFDLSHESDEAVEPIYEGKRTCVGYVPFSSLSHTTLLTSSYDIILVTIKGRSFWGRDYSDQSAYGGIKFVPRRSKSDEVQTTDCSEFWGQKLQDAGKHPFAIQQCDSDSSVELTWKPFSGF